MKYLRWLNIILIITFLSACSSGAVPIPGAGVPTNTASLPQPIVTINHAPDPEIALNTYLSAFKTEDYNTMYSLLSKVSQDAITLEDFAKRNRDALNEMSESAFDYVVQSKLVDVYSSQISYSVTYHTVLVGDIQRDIIAKFTLEQNEWKLQWDDAMILPELAGGNILKMDYSSPARGNIYDDKGKAFAAQSEAYAFSIIPGNVTDQSIDLLVSEVWTLCGMDPDSLRGQIQDLQNTSPQFPIQLCEASDDESQRIRSIAPSGLQWETYTSRYYFDQGVASNVVGYTQAIFAEELEKYRRLGYSGSERVGKAGIEQWAENYLAGQRGGTLYVINPADGTPVTKLAERQSAPSDSVYLTLDRNLQYYTQQAIQGFTGAAVVIEAKTGRVLAMASSPGFDANAFSPDNPNAAAQQQRLAQGSFLNRATQGQYPLGSVFKIITMAAGMESGLYTQDTPFDCEYEWNKLPDHPRYDWTWQHCQDRQAAGEECNTSDSKPSGLLTLPEGLMRSCDPFFWDIGYVLFQNNRGNDIANMARAFGLGQPTGIQQIPEESGQINNPPTVVDVANQAIGQGDMLVTPLQVATFIAALSNGGTLYRPQLVEKVEPLDGGAATQIFKPEARSTLQVQPFRMDIIRNAMISVVENTRGTAHFRLRNLKIPVAGKTGTAESGSGKPHAWFAGYTMASDSTGLPDIAIAVILENQGEGSDWAAPVFEAIVETYYFGKPQTRPWYADSFDSPIYTPTPFGGVPTKTPKPGKNK